MKNMLFAIAFLFAQVLFAACPNLVGTYKWQDPEDSAYQDFIKISQSDEGASTRYRFELSASGSSNTDVVEYVTDQGNVEQVLDENGIREVLTQNVSCDSNNLVIESSVQTLKDGAIVDDYKSVSRLSLNDQKHLVWKWTSIDNSDGSIENGQDLYTRE